MVKNSKNLFIKFIFLVSIIALVSAFFIEYILGHQPCNLCILERIPYLLAIILVLLNYKFIQFEKFFVLLLTVDNLRISKSNEVKPEIKKVKKQQTEKREYKIKDHIVYPKHGVGQITELFSDRLIQEKHTLLLRQCFHLSRV